MINKEINIRSIFDQLSKLYVHILVLMPNLIFKSWMLWILYSFDISTSKELFVVSCSKGYVTNVSQFLRTGTRQIANKLYSVVSPSFWCSVFFNDVFNIFSYLSLFGLNSDQKKSIYLILLSPKRKDSLVRIFWLPQKDRRKIHVSLVN